ncbi:hypothetical protein VZT92_006521 [Zoarces viviparus]|uniref:Uncharacterized protein n=1 Tax=Zoarces viviparus TaxID=48416 RepID=A0AAW1FPJ5_ZOAVI
MSCPAFRRLEARSLAVGRFFVSPRRAPCPVPLTAPTKLPAYPSSPTPTRATGPLQDAPWTNPSSVRADHRLRDHSAAGSIYALKAVNVTACVNGINPQNTQI